MNERLRSNYIKNSRGLTLVELLVSIVLLSILLTSFFQVFIQSMNYSNNNNEKIDSVAVARMAASKMKQVQLSDLQNPDHTFKSNDEINHFLGINETEYIISYDNLPPHKPDETIEMYVVTISVEHVNHTGPNSSAKTYVYLRNN